MLRIILLVMSALFVVMDTSMAGVMLDRVVAVVNKEAITRNELYRAMEIEMSVQIKALSAEQRRFAFRENEAVFLESMIDVKLQLQEAERLGITVSDDDISSTIEDIKNSYSMDEETFKAVLAQEGISLKEYKERLVEQIMISRVVEREVRNRIIIAGQDIKGSTDKDNVLYRIRQIFFRMPEDRDADAVRERASMVYESLKAGEDFQALARQYSEDPTARTGGDLGFIKKSQLAEEFAVVLKGMKPGDVSQPFRTEKGVHIIKLEEIRDAEDILFEERFQKQYKDWLRGLREKSFIEIKI